MGIVVYFQMEAYARGFWIFAFYHGDALGDRYCYCLDFTGFFVYGYISDGKFSFVGEESSFSCFGYFGGITVGGVRCVGDTGHCALDIGQIGSAFCRIFNRVFDLDGWYCVGNYDFAFVD